MLQLWSRYLELLGHVLLCENIDIYRFIYNITQRWDMNEEEGIYLLCFEADIILLKISSIIWADQSSWNIFCLLFC